MNRAPVFAIPAPPEPWVSEGMVRIVDPLGTAVAWVAPALAGACVAFSTRHPGTGAWHPVLLSDSSANLDPDGTLGIEALVGGPDGAVRPARIASSGWTMQERDPTSVGVQNTGGSGDLVIVCCTARAMEMRVEGTSFAGFRLRLPLGLGESDRVTWLANPQGHLVFAYANRLVTIEHSPILECVTDPTAGNGHRALHLVFRLTDRQSPGEPLSIRISDTPFSSLTEESTAPGAG